MSIDEIRSQKALALLEFTEAEANVSSLEKDRQSLARELHAFASALDKIPATLLEDFDKTYGHLNPQSIRDLVQEIQEAKRKLVDATAKKNQFGL